MKTKDTKRSEALARRRNDANYYVNEITTREQELPAIRRELTSLRETHERECGCGDKDCRFEYLFLSAMVDGLEDRITAMRRKLASATRDCENLRKKLGLDPSS